MPRFVCMMAGAIVAVLSTWTLDAQQPDKSAAKPEPPAAQREPPAASPKPPTWDVTAPLGGPTRTLAFDTDEGTWMNLDVSPDGREIVFDLLGDLYTMPVSGGEARRLTSGPAFDLQPRYSPDGKSIAFVTDRDGLWNVWVMARDASKPRQVSKEKRWFVNSPTWSSDGQYLYARHHFVKERSLGAGEIWMYHVSGAEGLQVTEKTSWQKDAGEPALSPDGRYLYYSKDVTPGQNFEYNKDPHGMIYAVVRRDLRDGKEKTISRRPGGSIAPRPSPDGKHLAFVRRVGAGSVLFLHEIATGREWPIFDKLDKDMQEAWAIHGVYTQYAWSPDSRFVFIWGHGKIWRVDVASRLGTEVPFRARVEQVVHEPLRFPQTVHTADVPVRMLRDVTTSPDGRTVAFGAVGHIYVRSLAGGEPKRLTKDSMLEFDPAFSPDGRSLVYTTWSDEAHGRVRVARVDGSGGRDIVSRPGHYIEPSFSPDGKRVVFRSVRADGIRDVAFDAETGIFIVPADGSASPVLVRDAGTEPQFDHTGTRIYVRERRAEKFALISTDLEGDEEQVHFQSENATQIVPSPDGRWVAFAERWHAYVAAFPRTGRPIDLAPKGGAYPVARVSRDAGMYLHWSGDSRRVHWTLGPEYFSRDLARTFSFVTEGLEKADEPEAKGVPIGFSVKSDVPAGAVALVGARIVPLDDAGTVIERGTVVVEGNRITALGPAESVTIPAGAARIDVAGKTIIPGLIDAHAHVSGESDGILSGIAWPFVANLAYGVTTAHDPSNDTETVFTNAELIRTGAKLGPRLFSTGTILYGAETPFKAVVESYDDALAHLRRMKAVGAFSVKSYNQQRRDARQMIIKAARELRMMVVPEGGSLLYMDESMVHDGHTGVEHSLPAPVLYKDVVTLFAKSGAGYTPTLIVGFGGLSGEYYWYQHSEVWKNERLLSYVPRDVVVPRSRRRTMAAEDDFGHVLLAQGAKKIDDAGGLVQLGAHGQLQGLGAHWELWMFVQGGMTPMQALRCGTIDGARYLGLDRELGSLERGKLADLVVLDKNPLENIRNSDSVRMVMVNGRLYDASTMNEIGNHPRQRPPFYWERQTTAPEPTTH